METGESHLLCHFVPNSVPKLYGLKHNENRILDRQTNGQTLFQYRLISKYFCHKDGISRRAAVVCMSDRDAIKRITTRLIGHSS